MNQELEQKIYKVSGVASQANIKFSNIKSMVEFGIHQETINYPQLVQEYSQMSKQLQSIWEANDETFFHQLVIPTPSDPHSNLNDFTRERMISLLNSVISEEDVTYPPPITPLSENENEEEFLDKVMEHNNSIDQILSQLKTDRSDKSETGSVISRGSRSYMGSITGRL